MFAAGPASKYIGTELDRRFNSRRRTGVACQGIIHRTSIAQQVHLMNGVIGAGPN